MAYDKFAEAAQLSDTQIANSTRVFTRSTNGKLVNADEFLLSLKNPPELLQGYMLAGRDSLTALQCIMEDTVAALRTACSTRVSEDIGRGLSPKEIDALNTFQEYAYQWSESREIYDNGINGLRKALSEGAKSGTAYDKRTFGQLSGTTLQLREASHILEAVHAVVMEVKGVPVTTVGHIDIKTVAADVGRSHGIGTPIRTVMDRDPCYAMNSTKEVKTYIEQMEKGLVDAFKRTNGLDIGEIQKLAQVARLAHPDSGFRFQDELQDALTPMLDSVQGQLEGTAHQKFSQLRQFLDQQEPVRN